MELPQAAVDLIESGAHAHLITVNGDGSPQGSMVWSRVIGGEICVPSFREWQKIKDVRRDPRVLVSYESEERHPRSGLRCYLIVHGVARVTAGGAYELMASMASRFLEPGQPPPGAAAGADAGFVMQIRPVKVLGNGPWTWQ